MGKKKAKPVDTLRTETTAANTAAAAISPQQQAYDESKMKLWNIYSGKEKFELSKLPGANVALSLYDNAKAQSDRGRIGKGLSYAGGADGYNPNLIASIDEQTQNEREMAGKGQIEGWVGNQFNGLDKDLLMSGQLDQQRRDNNFNRTYSLYNTEAQAQAQRDAKPKWWQSVLGGAAGVAGGWATGGFKLPK